MFEDDIQSREMRIPLWRTQLGPADWTIGFVYLCLSLAEIVTMAMNLDMGTFLGWFLIWLLIGAPWLLLYLLPWSRSWIGALVNVAWILMALGINANMLSHTMPT